MEPIMMNPVYGKKALITGKQLQQLHQNFRAKEQDPDFDPKPVVKLFYPAGAFVCLLSDVDPEDNDIAFGLCDHGFQCPELGSVSLSEMIAYVHPVIKLGIERDLRFNPDKTILEYARQAWSEHRIVA